jgi:hypothetical protein
MEVDKVPGGGNVIARFIPEKRKPQKRGMEDENRDKDDGKELKRRKAQRTILKVFWQSERMMTTGDQV